MGNSQTLVYAFATSSNNKLFLRGQDPILRESFAQPCRRSRRTTASRTTRFSSKSQVPSLTRLTITKIALASLGQRRPTLEGLATPLDKQSLILDQIHQEPHLGITTAKLTLEMQTLTIAMGTVYQLHAPAAAIACQNLKDHV
jgi:hypothetical protein